jgi:hypothetical protein
MRLGIVDFSQLSVWIGTSGIEVTKGYVPSSMCSFCVTNPLHDEFV